MRDPNPENISGEKVRRHVFKHEINWGHVALAVAVVAVAWVILRTAGSERDGREEAI